MPVGDRQVPREVLIAAASAFLIDLDGTVYTEAGAIPGADSALRELRRRGVPFRFVTNTTRCPRRQLCERLAGYGMDVPPEELFTAVLAGASVLRASGARRVAPFVPTETLEDLAEFELAGGIAGGARGRTPDAVLIGDLGRRWNHAFLNEAFRYVMDGAGLVALQRGRYWQGADGLELDAGAYVAALEFATGRDAVVCGKPNPHFFQAAVASLGRGAARRDDGTWALVGDDVPSERGRSVPPIVMIGDDLWSDIEGAHRAGLRGWLVRTGKFCQDALGSSGIVPDRVLDSLASLGGTGM